MPLKDNLLLHGVLKCRDLVELYFGARMVASLIENGHGSDTATGDVKIINQDQRRVKYEIIFANIGAAAASGFLASSQDQLDNQPQVYRIPAGDTVIVERDFFTDLDAVTIAVWCNTTANTLLVTTRETFLTPAPVDEVPLG